MSNKSTASTKFPLTFPATVALANPEPIDLDKSSMEMGFSKDFMELSGRVILIIFMAYTNGLVLL